MSIGGVRGASAVLAVACLAVTMVGCSGSSEPLTTSFAIGTPTPTPTPTFTSPPTPAPTPTPTPALTPSPETDTCDTAFTTELNTKIATDGLTFRDAGPRKDLDSLVGADGLRCEWTKPHTDLTVRYANWTRDTAAWDALKAQLLADGYGETGPFSVSRPVSEFDSAYSYEDGVIHYSSPSQFIGWVTALQ